MTRKRIFKNRQHATDFYLSETENFFNKILIDKNLDENAILKLDFPELHEKKQLVESLIYNKQFIRVNSRKYMNEVDFRLLEKDDSLEGFLFKIDNRLQKIKFFIQYQIDKKIDQSSVKKITELVENLPDNENKEMLVSELNHISVESINVEKSQIFDKKYNLDMVELENHKAEIFGKKADVWLKILGRESIASILGALLLLILAGSIIVIMYLGKEPIKIVETAFLLILGYFFGQSNSKNSN